ncbi:MAG: UvrD-helicase domain-containing protein [Tepidimonas sp.]|uniref:ATP-dependent helicase n=1 Tax=Tepidimonas sp. TaxID=2002775 RepID=UPI00259F0BAD|nr:UvrD-helicase domain-containing protein [Tepidimonas sp.]MDM7456364.1 UvrD-helicase domain-containing protein [Tepidimonas sp.]
MHDTLNPAQLDAVYHLRGPSLVLAGAGSGKTRVITHKIARLIQTGLEPERIAAITFTNKAAAEMRERARTLVGKAAQGVLLCTFHALGVRILREDGAALGLKPQFSILDADDIVGLLKDCGGTTDTTTARHWQWRISQWKGAGLTPEQALAQARDEAERQIALVMARYHERLAAYQAVDFDDLILLPLKLLREHAEVRQRWQQRLGHVLVDEYQDTSAVQYELLKALVGHGERPDPPLTCVGDDDQSIYGWRGATLDNLKRLPQDFPTLKVIKLEQNYRSTNAILRAANAVIGPNPKLFPKTLWSALGEGEPVRVLDCDHEEHEAERAVARIQGLRAQGAAWRDCAILYRANHQSRAFEVALRKAQIPYRVSGGTGFFDRAEIKDLCAWLRLLANEDDDPAFLRAVTTPRRGIGHQTLAQLGQVAAGLKLSLFETLLAPTLQATLAPKALAALHEFGRFVHALQHRARHAVGHEAARVVLMEWLADIGYERHLHDHADSAQQATQRWANVLDFVDWMVQRCGGQLDDTGGVALERTPRPLLEVAQTVALISTLAEREQDQDAVTLSTLHAAKGLEWPHVMLVGVNEGLLPFKPDADGEAALNAARIEEERRLMYVGITRAQRTLVVSWLRARRQGRQRVAAQPSRFIAEMQLDAATAREDPRARLRALREEFAARASARPASPP